MTVIRTRQFTNDFAALSPQMQQRAAKQLALFFENPRHPSLHVKKMKGFEEIWEGRISRVYRFTFQIEGDTHIMRRIGPHDILAHP